MPFLAGGADIYWMYWLCQAFGWSALLWAWITVMLGLVRSTRPAGWLPVGPQPIEKLHRTTSLTTVALMFLHAFWFFAEEVRGNTEGFGVLGRVTHAFANVFVPGVYPSGTGVVGIFVGLLAFYLAIPLGLAFYARRRIGTRVWRVLHASIVLVYVLSAWHTLLYSTTIWFDGWLRTTVWLLQLPPAALLLIRLLAPAHRPNRGGLNAVGRWVARGAVAATIVTTLLVAASGRDGGRTHGVPGAELTFTRPMIWLGFVGFVLVVGFVVVRAHRANRRAANRRATNRAGRTPSSASTPASRVRDTPQVPASQRPPNAPPDTDSRPARERFTRFG